MKKKTTCIGLILGAVMMIAATGTGAVFGADRTTKKGAVPVSAESKAQGNKTAAKTGGDEKNLTLFYGKVSKVNKDELELDSASVVWEMADEKEKKGADIAADLETSAMKWKLDGKKLKIKTDKDTKFVKETSATSDKTDKKNSGKASSAGAAAAKNTAVKLEDIKEGMLLKVTVKDAGSMTAGEVLVIDGVKEVKPAKATETARKTETKKAR